MNRCSLLSFRKLLMNISVRKSQHTFLRNHVLNCCYNENYDQVVDGCHNIDIIRKISTFHNLSRNDNIEKKCLSSTPGALVLGVYAYDCDIHCEHIKLSPTAEKFNDLVNGRIVATLEDGALPFPRLGDTRSLYGLDDKYPVVVMTGVGDPCKGYNEKEQIDEKKEAIRVAAGTGCQSAQPHNLTTVYVDTMGHAESAAEGAMLGVWLYQDLKDPDLQKTIPKIEIFDSCDVSGWTIGVHKAAAQNIARFLTESPGNQLTPSLFTSTAVELLSKSGVNVNVRMKHWAKLRNLHAFLAVGQGSCEGPIFLEALYEGCDPDICPIVLIGKGVTFDSGGLCLRKCKDMEHARGDMSGAATVVAVLKAIAALQLPINVYGFIPLCENLPGASAIHPGSIVRNVSDKSLLIRNTDDEGTLMLADALSYAKELNPKLIIDIGNYTPQGRAAMGSSASIVFSNNESLYETLRIASIHTGDRIWRFPLWKYFTEYLKINPSVDIQNVESHKSGGGVCKAAAFMREFINKTTDWVHIDTYGVNLTSNKAIGYLRDGMSGRPTRTIVEFLAQLACHNPKKKESKGGCGAKKTSAKKQ